MNATKKISSILALGAIGAMVLTGCAKSISRTDAEAVLDKANTTVTASGYVMPTKLTESHAVKSGAVKTAVSSTADSYFHTSYSGDYSVSDRKGNVTFSASDKTEAFAYKDGSNYVFGMTTDGTTGTFYSSTSADAMTAYVAVKNASISTTITTSATTSAASMSKYLKGFAEGTSPVTSGTILKDTYMKSESYKSKGDGNLELEITPCYVNEGNKDEPMKYSWDNNLPTLVQNDLNSTKDTYNWGSADTGKKVPSSWTAASNIIDGGALIIAVVAVL